MSKKTTELPIRGARQSFQQTLSIAQSTPLPKEDVSGEESCRDTGESSQTDDTEVTEPEENDTAAPRPPNAGGLRAAAERFLSPTSTVNEIVKGVNRWPEVDDEEEWVPPLPLAPPRIGPRLPNAASRWARPARPPHTPPPLLSSPPPSPSPAPPPAPPAPAPPAPPAPPPSEAEAPEQEAPEPETTASATGVRRRYFMAAWGGRNVWPRGPRRPGR